MAQINWTEQAKDDLLEIHDYLEASSERYADFVIDTIIESAEQLQNFPRIGRVVPEMNNLSIRELIVLKHRVIYVITSVGIIEILTIRHSSRPLADTEIPPSGS